MDDPVFQSQRPLMQQLDQSATTTADAPISETTTAQAQSLNPKPSPSKAMTVSADLLGLSEKSGNAQASDFAGFKANDLTPNFEGAGVQKVGEDGKSVAVKTPKEPIGREAFCDMFAFSFSAPTLLPMFSDFAPLAVTPEERPESDKAANALYNILERHFPRALMMSDETVDFAVFGTFMMGKIYIAAAILKARREPQAQTVQHDDITEQPTYGD